MATHERNVMQAQRRRAGERYRLEVQIDTSTDEGLALVDFLANRVPRHEVSAFVRAAVAERIARSGALEGEAVDAAPALPLPPTPGADEQASGLDMSGTRRPRATRTADFALPPVDSECPPFNALAETRRLLAGIRQFNQNGDSHAQD